MKKLFYLIPVIALTLLVTSCETVDSGHKGVRISWGGETDMDQVYNEGLDNGINWLWDKMVQYDVREKTMVRKFEFNDKNNMTTAVEISLDYALDGDKINLLHKNISDYETKIIKTLKSAGKEVVPQYSSVELNISKRQEAEEKLSAILNDELPDFYVVFRRLQLTDVDLPKNVAKIAEETATQLERNKLAEKKEAEKVALAKAMVAESKGKYEAAQYDAKAKDILSQPQMLELKRLEIEELWARSGKSKYGSNNYFGATAPALFKNMK